MKTVRGVLKANDQDEKVALTFDTHEVDALNLYVTDMSKLLSLSFLRSPSNFHLSVKFNSIQSSHPESVVQAGEFNEEQWAAFLHLFRPLAGLNSDKDLYGFQRIKNLIGSRAASTKLLREHLKYLGEEFRGKMLPFGMTFGINGEEYDLEGVFVLWMNAMEFHRDTDKRLLLDQMSKMFPAAGIRALMANLAFEKLRAMAKLQKLVAALLAPPEAGAAALNRDAPDPV